jgi:periplasmic divalent cation tolerance protein
MSENAYTMVMVTTDDEDEAVELAKKLVAEKLAACVQITNIRSVFFWDGKTDDAQEYLLLAKTREAVYDELEAFIKENHDYDVPEILKVPILGGFGPYLQWVDENTTK